MEVWNVNPAGYALVFALLLGAFALLFRRGGATHQIDEATPAAAARTYEWDGTYRDAFQRTLDVMGALGAVVTHADPNRGSIAARIAPSLVSLAPFGASYRVMLATSGGITSVEVRASSVIPVLRNVSSAALLSRFEEIWLRLPLPTPSRTA